jgi:hypothetical protein
MNRKIMKEEKENATNVNFGIIGTMLDPALNG